MKPRFRILLIIGLIVAGLAFVSWRASRSSFGQDAPDRTYDSPVGQFTLPTVDGTAGTLGTDYKLAKFAFGVRTNVPQVGNLAGDTGNGFSDRYDFENLDAFTTLDQPANNIGDLDSMDPNNRIMVGGMFINPGFRFVHVGRNAFVWRVGENTDDVFTDEVTVFPSIDHLFDPEIPGYGPRKANPPPNGIGNVVLEACEFTVFGTNDPAEAQRAAETPEYFGRGGTGVLPNDKWFRASLTKVFAEGFKDYNGKSPFAAAAEGTDPSPQEGDDFASRWQFRRTDGSSIPVKFVAVYANRTRDEKFFRADGQGRIPGNLAQSNEAEIDAVGFKEITVRQASLSGRVINDANANGRIDPNEAPIPGVTITLTSSSGASRTTTTDGNGSYRFDQLDPGSYQVVETNLPGYLDTGVIPGQGNTAINLNTIAAALEAGEDSVENDFLDALPPQPPAPECSPACFNNTDIWLLYDVTRRATYDKIGGVGGIFILSLNRGALSDDEVVTALMGMDTPQQRLNAQYVAAQLNTATYPQSIFNRASCFFNGPNSNVRIPGDPRLLELLGQARTVYASNDPLQIDQLAVYLELINNVTATRGIICPFADP